MSAKKRRVTKTIIQVRPAPRNPCRAILQLGSLTFPAALGRAGRRAFKREGDGATPISSMRILSGYRRMDRVREARSGLTLRSIRDGDLWCDAPHHAAYNKPVRAPFRESHEEMRRGDGLYDLCIVLDWNVTSRRRYRGSAIFFHLAQADYAPTAGCIAVNRRHMLRLLPYLRRGTRIQVLA